MLSAFSNILEYRLIPPLPSASKLEQIYFEVRPIFVNNLVLDKSIGSHQMCAIQNVHLKFANKKYSFFPFLGHSDIVLKN